MSLDAAGTVSLGDLRVPRFGYGTMRLTGPRIWGPPADRAEAVRVLRRAVDAGVRAIDTAWYYGPFVANQILAEALSPYPEDLVIITKLGGARRDDASWFSYLRPEQIREGVEHDLRTLGVETIPVTHLRWMDSAGLHFEDALGTMTELIEEGKIQRIGLSNVAEQQLDLALATTRVVSVSNDYSVLNRDHDTLVDRCARDGIAFVPFFPLGASPVRSGIGVADAPAVVAVAERRGATPAQVALAWLLARSATMLPIAGTSSVAHLEENLRAGDVQLDASDLADLDAVAA
jgi:aryl-alcohol dehydrogenase-like predicted oxidoreductase